MAAKLLVRLLNEVIPLPQKRTGVKLKFVFTESTNKFFVAVVVHPLMVVVVNDNT